MDIIPDNFDLPLDVDITENQAKDFVESIQRALIARKSSLYLYAWERNAIVISLSVNRVETPAFQAGRFNLE